MISHIPIHKHAWVGTTFPVSKMALLVDELRIVYFYGKVLF